MGASRPHGCRGARAAGRGLCEAARRRCGARVSSPHGQCSQRPLRTALAPSLARSRGGNAESPLGRDGRGGARCLQRGPGAAELACLRPPREVAGAVCPVRGGTKAAAGRGLPDLTQLQAGTQDCHGQDLQDGHRALAGCRHRGSGGARRPGPHSLGVTDSGGELGSGACGTLSRQRLLAEFAASA